MTEVQTAEDFQIRELQKDNGIRIAAYSGKELSGVCSYGEVKEPEGESEASKIIRSRQANGISTFTGRVTVEPKYSGQGIGNKLLLEAQRKLLERHPNVIELLADDSVSPSSKDPHGWTERQIPQKLELARSLGYTPQIIFQGQVEDRPTWLIEYLKQN